MTLPLQPTPSPWPAWRRRLAALGAALIALGRVAPSRAAPARVVLTGRDRSMEFARAARRLIAGTPLRLRLDCGRSCESDDIDDKHEAPSRWLRAHGVKVVLDDPERTMHAKVPVVDRRRGLLSSHNRTVSALTCDREASILLDGVADWVERGLVATIPGME